MEMRWQHSRFRCESHLFFGCRNDEIGSVSRAFNRMTAQIRGQQEGLISANRELDERRRFTETVLAGVSAGVVGLDKDGRINLPNRSASVLVGDDLLDASGRCAPQPCPNASACCSMCVQKDPRRAPFGACSAWSFNAGSSTCWLKNGPGKATPRPSDTSGVVVARRS